MNLKKLKKNLKEQEIKACVVMSHFSVTPILREINIEQSTTSKTAVIAIFRGPEFCSFSKFQPSKSAKIHKTKIQSL